MEEVKHNTVAMFRMDDDTPFTDYSGYSATGTRTGTEIKGLPLTSSAGYSQKIDATHAGAFTVPNFLEQGTEAQSFSISFTAYVIDQATGLWVGKTDDTSGVGFLNNTVYALLKFDNTDIVQTTYAVDINRKFNVVAVWTPTAINLFLNGAMVTTIDIPEADLGTPFDCVVDTFEITGVGLVNNLAFYAYDLSSEQVKAIHDYNNTTAEETVAIGYGGQTVAIAMDNRKPFMEVDYGTDEAWNAGRHSSTVADNNELHAQKNDDLTVEGEWASAISLSSPAAQPLLASAYMIWNGLHETVEVSLDGVTWSAVTNQQNLSVIPNNFDPTNKNLMVRVTFDDGWPDAYLEYLTFRSFTGTAVAAHIDNRVIEYDGAAVVTLDAKSPELMRDDWGVKLGSASTLTVNTATGGETNKTLQVWVKPVGTSLTVTGWSSPTATYVNGASGSTLIAGAWNLVHITKSAGVTVDTVFGASQQIGDVVLYDRVLTAGEVASIVQSYTGIPKQTFSSSGSIAITEPATPANIYDRKWTNVTRVS